ncbi:MAG: CoA transferase, partial [Burkholderiaceae bacterium]
MTNEVRPRPVRPLEGIRVVDMSTVLVGPMCAQILADYGADVIKVESPDGDVMRDAGPMRNLRMGPMYLHANRNKRSLVLDVKKPAAREALLRICAESDCFITNTRPAAMERLQLDYPSIRAAREDIVYLSVVGYGQAGPYAHKPAVDDVIQAACGLAGLFSKTLSGPPAYVPLD